VCHAACRWLESVTAAGPDWPSSSDEDEGESEGEDEDEDQGEDGSNPVHGNELEATGDQVLDDNAADSSDLGKVGVGWAGKGSAEGASKGGGCPADSSALDHHVSDSSNRQSAGVKEQQLHGCSSSDVDSSGSNAEATAAQQQLQQLELSGKAGHCSNQVQLRKQQ